MSWMMAASPRSAAAIPVASVFIGARRTPAPNSKGLSEGLAVADYADGDAFDGERVAPQVDLDRRELGILRLELHGVAAPAQALHRDLVAEPRHHDLAAARLRGAVHGEEVAFQDAGVAHRHAAHAQEIVGTRREEIRIDLV